MPTWTEAVGAIGGVLGGAATVLAAIANHRAVSANRRSARAEERVAELTASTEARDRDRRHDELRPREEPEKIMLDRQGDALFASIRVNRRYAVVGLALTGETGLRPGASYRRVDLPPEAEANVPYRFEVEKYREGGPVTDVLLIKFWPPATANGWGCDCERPAAPSGSEPGHWEWSIPVAGPIEPLVLR